MKRWWNQAVQKRKFETREGRIIELADLRALGCPDHVAARVERLNGYTPVDGLYRSAPAPAAPADSAVDALRARLAAHQQIHVV